MHRQQGLYVSVYVDDITMAGKKDNLEPVWIRLMKHVDLEKSTSLLGQVFLACTQSECKPNGNLVDEDRNVFESRVSAGATDKLPDSEKK